MLNLKLQYFGHLMRRANSLEKTLMLGKIEGKRLKIEGMMCPRCEAHVKKALESLEEVASAEVSYQAGTAVVTLKKEIDTELLKQVIEAEDYTVLEIL